MSEPPPLPEPPQPTSLDNQSRTWCAALHASALAGFLGPGLWNWLVPLGIWLVKRADSPEINRQGKDVLNFQISWTIYWICAWILVFALIGLVAIIGVGILWLVYVIRAAIAAGDGQPYTYRFSMRFLK